MFYWAPLKQLTIDDSILLVLHHVISVAPVIGLFIGINTNRLQFYISTWISAMKEKAVDTDIYIQ